MIRRLTALSVMLLTLALAAPVAVAGTCECPVTPLDELEQGYTLAFTGRAIDLDSEASPPRMTFNREIIYKGVRLQYPVVALNKPEGDPSCNAEMKVGEDYFVIARGNYDMGYYTDFCAMVAANGDATRQQQLMASFWASKLSGSAIESRVDLEMKDLQAMRDYVRYLLESYNPEVALQMSKRAIELSRGSRIDLNTLGEAYLQLYLPRQALEKFDDVLERYSDNADGWRGRYRALAQMGRWSELPLQDVRLSKLLLRNASVRADLGGADLSWSWWEDVIAAGSKLVGADFSGARLVRVDFSGSTLDGSNFSRTRLRDVSFRGVDLTGVSFSGSTLSNVDLTGTILKDADFSGADLTAVDLRGIDLSTSKTDAATRLPSR